MKIPIFLGALASLIVAPMLCAQGTALTYQGRLNDGASPASGSYDLRFTLFAADPGGSQVGPTRTSNGIAVSNGLFTITLDFGANIFTNPIAFWKSPCERFETNHPATCISLHGTPELERSAIAPC